MPTTIRKTKTFTVCGTISVGDPCYSSPGFIVDAKEGNWKANVKTVNSFGNRVSRIIVHHENFNPVANLSTESHIIGVDSGQAGVFNDHYDGCDEGFYAECCKATLSKKGYGYVSNGFVSSSGYGDGGYEAVVFKQNDQAVCVEITFIEAD